MADPVQVTVRFGLYAALGMLFGLPLFALYGIDRAGRAALPLRRLIGGGALLGLGLSILGLAVLSASMAGVPLAEVDSQSIEMVATMPGIGSAWMIQVAAVSLLFVAAILLRDPTRLAITAAILGSVALASLAAIGHAATTEGIEGPVHLAADIAHLLSAGAWLGALAGLLLLIAQPPISDHPATVHRALAGFAAAGTVVVSVLVVSGVANGWFILGNDILAIGGTLYSQLLLAKLGLFAAMLGLAAAHRFRMTPALARGLENDPTAALARLRTSLAAEAVLGLAVLGLVAWLGVLQPAAAG